MRTVILTPALVLVLAGAVGLAQIAQPVPPSPGAVTYLSVTPGEIERSPERFQGAYVQIPDYFYRPMDVFPPALLAQGITPQTHLLFLTHRVLGSNMLCVVPRDNQEARAVLPTLIAESPIYLMGRVGPRVEVPEGLATLFFVDRLVRGHEPPARRKEEKKPVIVTLEWEVESSQGTTLARRRFKIPEPGKRYVIQDPSTGKRIYMTLEF